MMKYEHKRKKQVEKSHEKSSKPSASQLSNELHTEKLEGTLPFSVPFLKVYVDNIVTAIPKDGINLVLKTFNSINEKIQFTIEIENNIVLRSPFLDTTIIRNENDSIITNCECERCYIRQTKQKFKKRVDQQRNDRKLTNAEKTNTTALAEHHFKTGHNFKLEIATILYIEDNWYK
ncbi:hypothetical protein M0804_013714 [Polistes exclamans]|nr:hypothetical protein M0804_013714 [Polistes exclamans]